MNTNNDNILTDFPAFTPTKYEIKSRIYDNTEKKAFGTIKFYLPEIDRIVRVSCTNESATILENDDDSDFMESFIIAISFIGTLPKDTPQWTPMIKETLKYFAEQKLEMREEFIISAAWLPDSVRENADVDCFQWRVTSDNPTDTAKGGAIIEDEEYN